MSNLASLVNGLTHIGAWSIDVGTHKVNWSESMHTIIRTDPHKFVPTLATMRQACPRLAEFLFAWALQPSAAETRHVTIKTSLLRSDGTTVQVSVIASPKLRGGSLFQVNGFIHDLDAAQAQREQQDEAEQRYRMLFHYAPNALIQAKADKRIVLVNPAACRLLGYSSEELCSMTTVDITHPDDRAASAEAVRMLWDGMSEQCSYQKRYVRRDGSSVWIQLGVSLLRDASGKPLSFIGQCQEISRTEDRRSHVESGSIAEASRGKILGAQIEQLMNQPDADLNYLGYKAASLRDFRASTSKPDRAFAEAFLV